MWELPSSLLLRERTHPPLSKTTRPLLGKAVDKPVPHILETEAYENVLIYKIQFFSPPTPTQNKIK